MKPAGAAGTAAGKLISGAAVSSKRLSPMGLQERLFALAFRGLVYPQIWEDPVCDMAGLQVRPGEHLVTIASGGCNALSYLTADPGRVTAVDLNAAHIALNRLKHAALVHLDADELQRFIADADSPANIDIYRTKLAANLDPSSRAYWEGRDLLGRTRIGMFGKGLYRYGLLGTFIGFAHLLARLNGIDPRRVLEANGRAEQRAIFEAEFHPFFDKPLIKWLTGQKASLFGLGIPPAQYDKLAGGKSMAQVLRERLEKLTCDFDLADNYFAWQAFSRGYQRATEASLPPYLQPANRAAVRERLERIDVRHANLTDVLAGFDATSVDCFVLLDAQDWMTDTQLNALWAQVCRTARPGARVLFRTADEPTLLPGRLDPELLAMWDYRQARSAELTRQDRSSIYGGVHLYVRRG
jgi:S-adenosylmethionine-diacylglycerol 3-amino-3-carboxypropyl transferase